MSIRGYEAVIGLEIHAQLKTTSKIFSSDGTNFDAGDNENTSPVSVGMPGTLPVLNQKVLELAIKAGLALNCKINPQSVFARKNYFYPDLPKGYQISQYDQPICENGYLDILVNDNKRRINIVRAHLEEDAGKSTHLGDATLLNYNRAGIPLLEIVSAPEIKSAVEAAEYARAMRQVLKYIEVCDGNLEEGSLRCDCNVSVRKVGETKLGTKVELKNINSFRFVEKAIDFEIDRQIDAIERGDKIVQETRLYDPDKNRTYSMRTKEDAQDYRYFPDPDLLPVVVTQQTLESFRKSIPELPMAMAERFQKEYLLPSYDAHLLTDELSVAQYFEAVAKASNNAKSASNWIMSELMRELKDAKIEIANSPINANMLADLIEKIDKGEISGKMAKDVFAEMWATQKSPQEIIKAKGMTQISDKGAVETLVEQVLEANPSQVAEYKSGKTKILGFLVGATMKLSKGQANPDLVNQILLEKLKG